MPVAVIDGTKMLNTSPSWNELSNFVFKDSLYPSSTYTLELQWYARPLWSTKAVADQ